MDLTEASAASYAIIEAFNAAFNRHDVAAIMALMTDDCVFENTSPTPDGTRYRGHPAVREFWNEFFAASPNAHFETEDLFASADRATCCWRYTWVDEQGQRGHVRGVDVFRLRDGKVAEKLAYVKG